MKNNKKLFIPIDGVIVEVEKNISEAGIELLESALEQNVGIVRSGASIITSKKTDFFDTNTRMNIEKVGAKIKFTEGFKLDNGFYFVKFEHIIGLFA